MQNLLEPIVMVECFHNVWLWLHRLPFTSRFLITVDDLTTNVTTIKQDYLHANNPQPWKKTHSHADWCWILFWLQPHLSRKCCHVWKPVIKTLIMQFGGLMAWTITDEQWMPAMGNTSAREGRRLLAYWICVEKKEMHNAWRGNMLVKLMDV